MVAGDPVRTACAYEKMTKAGWTPVLALRWGYDKLAYLSECCAALKRSYVHHSSLLFLEYTTHVQHECPLNLWINI